MADHYQDLDLADDCSPLRIPPHSANPFGNEGFELLRQGALAAERAAPKPEEHGEAPAEQPSPEDLRDRRIRALEADVAALRCSLARLETIIANLTAELG